MIERPVLELPENSTQTAQNFVASKSKAERDILIDEAIDLMESQQPALANFLEEMRSGELEVFSQEDIDLGMALTYNLIPQEERNNPIPEIYFKQAEDLIYATFGKEDDYPDALSVIEERFKNSPSLSAWLAQDMNLVLKKHYLTDFETPEITTMSLDANDEILSIYQTDPIEVLTINDLQDEPEVDEIDVKLASILILLPFYLRAEARRLEANL